MRRPPHALVYALLIGKAKISAKLHEAFRRRWGLFERECFQTPVVEALVRRLHRIPLYPFGEPNTTFLAYLQQDRMAHYEVNEATGALECEEFVKKPARVVCKGFVGVSATKLLRRLTLRRRLLMKMKENLLQRSSTSRSDSDSDADCAAVATTVDQYVVIPEDYIGRVAVPQVKVRDECREVL